eukprot:jgi/Ulvmu1/5202/UM210_0002.1
MACTPVGRTCARIVLKAVIILGLAFTLLCCAALLYVSMGVSGCDITCNEGSDGAELLNEGYYECDGDTGCGPLTGLFYFMLALTLPQIGLWLGLLGCCCRRRRRRRAATKAAVELGAAPATLPDHDEKATANEKAAATGGHAEKHSDTVFVEARPGVAVSVAAADASAPPLPPALAQNPGY